ncbi:hypothetical protein OG976_12395 [Mycobacterium sp. NBC_00419]|uniref:hypothetical protein n=1 Tax=Mycobacterium sp. NBC_00419 TaxID=2975989 RepID=UPI002E1BAB96
MIAGGVLYGGAGTLAAVPAAAEPGTVNNGPATADTDAGEPSNDQGAINVGGHRPRRPGGGHGGTDTSADTASPSVEGGQVPAAGRPGAHRFPRANQLPALPIRPGAAAADEPDPDIEVPGFPEDPEYPNWPWPWPPCDHDPGNGGNGGSVGSPAPSVGIARPPQSAGGGSGGGIGFPPVTVPTVPGVPTEPTPVSAGGEHAAPAATGEPATLEMPPLIGLPPVFEAPLRPVGGPNGNAPAESGPGRGNPVKEPATGRERLPASVGSGTEAAPSFRVGYPEYLREAKIGEVAALALPGFAGLLALTALGGVFGYRQAKAGHGVRAAGTARFMR